MKKPVTGLNRAEATMMSDAISRDKTPTPDAPTAKCNKCHGPLRVSGALLAAVKRGVVDHAGCGGQFVVLGDAR